MLYPLFPPMEPLLTLESSVESSHADQCLMTSACTGNCSTLFIDLMSVKCFLLRVQHMSKLPLQSTTLHLSIESNTSLLFGRHILSQVKVLTTKASEHFLERSEAYNLGAYAAFKALEPPPPILGDADEWRAWDAVGDPVLHIEVRMGRCFVRITRIGY